MRRLRSAADSRSRSGVSTYTTVHWASSASAMRLPARTTCSACSSGPMATSTRSRAIQAREVRSASADARAAASTRSATRRSASSRSAIRFDLRKKRSIAVRDLLGHVDLAGLEPREQIVGRQVDQLDFVGLVEDAIRDRLALAHAGDLRDQVVETLEVLDVDRRPDIDALLEQLLDVLPALRVARRRIAFDEIGMRQLVDEQDRGPALAARRRDRIRGASVPR